MRSVLTIPKGKNILESFQYLDGIQNLTGDEWLFMHRTAVEELMRQAGPKELAPIIILTDGNCSFSLYYGSSRQPIGAIALRSEPCYDDDHRPLWFIVTHLFFFENSPIQLAFRHPSAHPSKAIFLELAE
ncbi:MAG: hypothetical protein HFJ30_01275 [Clostridia bacterium]|jgi:hypothetical protein|nr:hypothetical protein [Clostridia bacterium]